tara:strand:- start:451 stop:642 length:192 start_codon:yes stop_codon:yes gene_type:complete
MDTKEVLGGLIEITLDLIDNVWRMKLHTQIQRRGHTDENDITNFGNVIFELVVQTTQTIGRVE